MPVSRVGKAATGEAIPQKDLIIDVSLSCLEENSSGAP